MSTQPPTPITVPSTPDLTSAQFWTEIIQAILALLGAAGIAVPSILQTPSVVAQLAGLASLLASIVWSYLGAKNAQATAHASAVASAKMARPVRVV